MATPETRRYQSILLLLLMVSLFTNGYLLQRFLWEPQALPEEGNLDIIWHGPEDKPWVALTFDDGPTLQYTARVLDILRNEKIHATFFVVGQSAKKYPGLIRRMVREGHEVENHTYAHPYLTNLTMPQIRDEIRRGHDIIRKLTGREPIYFRPPRQLYDSRVLYALREIGHYDMCLWSFALEHHEVPTPNAMIHRASQYARKGEIILAHDGQSQSNREATLASLPKLIELYKKKGCRFVTIKEMFE